MEQKTRTDLILPNNATSLQSVDSLNDLKTDLDEVKTNLLDVADDAAKAIKDMVELAKASQNPLYYEALSKMLIASARVNREATLTLKTKIDAIEVLTNEAEDEPQSKNTTNNNMFITTEDAMRLMQEKGE